MINLAAIILFCGSSISVPAPAPIVGGLTVPPKLYPFIAHITDPSSSCTGVILDQSTLLTAGHCGVTFSTSDGKGPKRGIQIIANNVQANSKNPSKDSVSFQVQSIIISPQFKEYPNFSNDISIWKVKVISGDLNLIPRVELDGGYFAKPSTQLTVAGFGQTQGGEATQGSPRLLSINAPVQDSTKCSNIYKDLEKTSSPPPGFDINSQLCAGDLQGNKGACFGDSGGPLFYMNGNTPVIVGIVSHGNGANW